VIVLRSKRRAAPWAAFAGVYGAFGVWGALAGMLEGGIISLGLAALLGGTAIWRKLRRDEISSDDGKLRVTRCLGPIRLSHKEIAVDAHALVDHESRPDAMFAVTAMTGPGYLQLRGKDGTHVEVARGLGYDDAALRELEERVRKLR
jgi:hypothetical protein